VGAGECGIAGAFGGFFWSFLHGFCAFLVLFKWFLGGFDALPVKLINLIFSYLALFKQIL
jgi:hypothetical protein